MAGLGRSRVGMSGVPQALLKSLLETRDECFANSGVAWIPGDSEHLIEHGSSGPE